MNQETLTPSPLGTSVPAAFSVVPAVEIESKIPFYKRPKFIVPLVLLVITVGVLAVWLVSAYVYRDQKASIGCQLLKPIMKITDIRQQEYNERCRVAWIRMTVPFASPANVLAFDLEFISNAGAAGLVTVALDDEQLATIHETQTKSGKNHYVLNFQRREPGDHQLTFRAVPTTDVRSAVDVSDIGSAHISIATEDLSGIRKLETKKNEPLNFSSQETSSYVQSKTGAITFDQQTINLRATPDNPAWLVMTFDQKEKINFLSFDVDFTSDPAAEGLLALYIDEELFYTKDERYVIPEIDSEFAPVGKITENGDGETDLPPGTHTLSIRLDAHSTAETAVRLSNLQSGLAFYSKRTNTEKENECKEQCTMVENDRWWYETMNENKPYLVNLPSQQDCINFCSYGIAHQYKDTETAQPNSQ